MLTTVRHIFGRIMHSETALHSQWDKGRKNNLLFASPSIRRPTIWLASLKAGDAVSKKFVRLVKKTAPHYRNTQFILAIL